MPAQRTTVLGRDRAARRLDAAHAAALDDEPGRLASSRTPARRPPRPPRGPSPRRRGRAFAIPSRSTQQAADDPVGVDERDALGDLGRRQQRRVEAVAARAAVAAVELGPPLLGRRDLDAADRVVAGQPVELEAGQQVDRRPRELGHRVRRVELEDEPGRVRRRAAGLPQRALVDDHEVGPSPRAARWWTTLAPTMPAPTITARALDGRVSLVAAAVASLMAN